MFKRSYKKVFSMYRSVLIVGMIIARNYMIKEITNTLHCDVSDDNLAYITRYHRRFQINKQTYRRQIWSQSYSACSNTKIVTYT